MNKPRKDIRASLPTTKVPASADSSGGFPVMPEMFEPIVPLLKKSVAHMRESNGFVRDNNLELRLIQRSIVRQMRFVQIGAFLGVMLLLVLFFLVGEQQRLQQKLDEQLDKQEETNTHLALVSQKLRKTYAVTKETKEAVEAQPRLEVKPADSSDPKSKPSLVVRMPPVKVVPSKPVSIEIPLEKKK